MPLLVLFIIIPAIELALFIKVGAIIGVFPILAFIFLSAVIGMAVMQRQGVSTLFKVNEKLEKGETPANEVIQGFLLGVGGVFLILPGFLTDFLGILLLIPPIRRRMASYILRKSAENGQNVFRFYQQATKKNDEHTFDGEFTREEKTKESLESKKK